jgi:hypothetical protein
MFLDPNFSPPTGKKAKFFTFGTEFGSSTTKPLCFCVSLCFFKRLAEPLIPCFCSVFRMQGPVTPCFYHPLGGPQVVRSIAAPFLPLNQYITLFRMHHSELQMVLLSLPPLTSFQPRSAFSLALCVCTLSLFVVPDFSCCRCKLAYINQLIGLVGTLE